MPATLLRQAVFCSINGIPTPAYEADGHCGVDRPISTASVTIPAPTPAHIDINAPIEIQGGYQDGVIRPLFSGRITDTEEAVTERGPGITIHAEGWEALLDWEQETDLVFSGPIRLYEIVRSLCQWRGVPSYRIDQVTAPDGFLNIALGGVDDYENGDVIIPRRTSPLTWLRRVLGLFGYRIFGGPSGLRVQRVSGLPSGPPVATYAVGSSAYNLRRTRDVRTMATYITVEGPRYTDSDGIVVVPRSIASEVPSHPYLVPPGYRADDIKDDVIVTGFLASIVRNIAEIDGGAPTVHQRWETRGDALREPGEVVTVSSDLLGTDADLWLMALDWRIDDVYTATMEGWAGGGEALPAGIDEHSIDVLTSPVHVGDEHVPWYVVPSPSGREVVHTITVPETYTSLYYTARVHGSNSQFIDGQNEDLTLSKIVTTQNGEEVGSADLPVVPENYAQQLDYDNPAHWQTIRGPIPGRYEPGQLKVAFVSGENSALPESTKWDDWEIDDVTFHFSGIGTPILPGTGG